MSSVIIKPIVFLVACISLSNYLSAQVYPPGVGQIGSDAMHKDSSAFVSWAVTCTVSRGLQDISNSALGLASAGDSTLVPGKADGSGIVSLGDGGSAICTFPFPLTNAAGPDFAVFENGFDDAFLELAFVEVSSDGINFFRFPAHSRTDTVNQTNSFGATDPTKIYNLAGKYRGGYGTPFDLESLSGTPGLKLNAVTHIKIIDVVGSLNKAYATYDSRGNRINDPWPTPFASGGFDLDAIGVINENKIVSLPENSIGTSILVFPNPVQKGGMLQLSGVKEECNTQLFSSDGAKVLESTGNVLHIKDLASGIYLLKINSGKEVHFERVVIE